MRTLSLKLFLVVGLAAGALAQTPTLQMNVVYVCTDGQSFKVFSCNDANGACDYQNYKKGQAYQRGEDHAELRVDAQARPRIRAA